jgi:hypothetical protein
LLGATVATSCAEPLTQVVTLVALSDIPETATETVTVQVAVLPPSAVVAVIVAEPTATPVTTPEEETVATLAALDDQLTF